LLLAVQDNLSKIGIKVTIALFQGVGSTNDYSAGADDLYVTGFYTGVENINQYQNYACNDFPSDQNPNGFNGTQICNPEMDTLWKVLGTSMNADERQKAADRIQQIIADNVYTIYLANIQYAIVINKNVEGWYWGGFAGNPLIWLNDIKRVQ